MEQIFDSCGNIIGWYSEMPSSCDFDEHENDNYYLGDYSKMEDVTCGMT